MEKYNLVEIFYYFIFPSLMMINFFTGGILYEFGDNILALIYFILGFAFLIIDIIPCVILHKRREKIRHPRNKKYYKKLDKIERRKNN